MPDMIHARTGRLTLFAIVMSGFVLALIVLAIVGRGGAVSEAISLRVVGRLMKLYSPLVGLMGAFYFSEKGHSTGGNVALTSTDKFAIACCVVGLWAGLPVLLLTITNTVEGAMRLLDSFEAFGSALAVTALAYYFSISARTKIPPRLGYQIGHRGNRQE